MVTFKKIAGTLLVSYAALGGIIFYLESLKIFDDVFSTSNTSRIWDASDASSMTPIFLGLCGIAGAMLLNSIKDEHIAIEQDENKQDENI
jgi:hypothetical protein